MDLLGCLSFLRALASIWRILSRVTENCSPTSSKVWSVFIPTPNLILKTLSSLGVKVDNILVATKERPEVKIDWRIYTKNPEKPLIRDLIIEGLSLARTQKEEFNSIIQSNDGDIEALFTSLKDFVKK